MNIGPMLNAYPDSMGGTLDDIAAFLQKPEMKDVFSSCYVLPSLFHTDLDRGFSVISPQPSQNLFQSMKKSRYSDLSPFFMISWNCFDSTDAWFKIKSSFKSIPSPSTRK